MTVRFPGPCVIPAVSCLFGLTVVLNIRLFGVIEKGFFPNQDTGEMFGRITADQSISFQAMKKKFMQFADTIRSDPAIQNVTGFAGGGGGGPGPSGVNQGRVFVQLKPLNERDATTDEVIL